MLTKEMIMMRLSKIMDPELHIDIVSLGLIYSVTVSKCYIHVVMTLTTPGCPLAPLIDRMVKEALEGFDKEVVVELVWDPPWTKEMMSEEARLTVLS